MRVAAAFLAADRRRLVTAAFRPAARCFRVAAAFWPGGRRFRSPPVFHVEYPADVKVERPVTCVANNFVIRTVALGAVLNMPLMSSSRNGARTLSKRVSRGASIR